LTYINAVPSSTSTCHPWIADIVFIEIFTIDGGGIIGVAISVAVAIGIAFTISAIAVVPIIANAYRRYPIVVVQSPSSNCRPWISAIVVIDIIWIGGGGSIIAITFAIIIAVAISTIAVVAIILDVALLTSLHHHRCRCAPWRHIGGSGPNHATEALPMAFGWPPLFLDWLRRGR
jgi:hypothetical protein